MLPLLGWYLQRSEAWPPSLREAMLAHPAACQDAMGALREQRRHALLRETALLQMARYLDDLGMDAILHKGSAYERCVYPQIGMRSMRDIDLLVTPEGFTALSARLLKEGYLRHPADHTFEQTFIHPSGRLFFDIHFGLSDADELQITIAKLLQQSSASAIHPRLRLLSPPAMLIFHLHHLRRNGLSPLNSPLLYFAELSALLRLCEPLQADLERTACDWHAQTLLAAGRIWHEESLLESKAFSPRPLQQKILLAFCALQRRWPTHLPFSERLRPRLSRLIQSFSFDSLDDLRHIQRAIWKGRFQRLSRRWFR